MTPFNLYLTGRAQKHFGLKTKDIQHDSEATIAPDWHLLWRMDHLVSQPDGSQHLFIVTNAASLYSFLIPINGDGSFEDVISIFYQYWFDAVISRGFQPPLPVLTRTNYLRGKPNSLIGAMNMLVYHAELSILERQNDIKTTHERIRHMPMKKGKEYILPDDEFERLLDEHPPYPRLPQDPQIIRFPN